jgi:putative transposase
VVGFRVVGVAHREVGPSAGFSVCTAKYSPQEVPSMALSESVVSELLEAFRADEGGDLIRESVQLVLQDLIETEAAERIGADRYKRTHAGHRP